MVPKKRKKRDRRPIGGAFESFLEEQGIGDEVYEHAVKAMLAWQLDQEMKRQDMSKVEMARMLGTSRTEIYRVLAELRGLAESGIPKCLIFLNPTGEGRHYAGGCGWFGSGVILGADCAGNLSLSLSSSSIKSGSGSV
jgi:hypothetical protein